MTNDYERLQKNYRQWKEFLVKEFDNYTAAKEAYELDRDPRKKRMVVSYENIQKTVIAMEKQGVADRVRRVVLRCLEVI